MTRPTNMANRGDVAMMQVAAHQTLAPHDLRRVAVAAECDPRTVRRYLSGKPIRDLARRRIERAMATMVGLGQ